MVRQRVLGFYRLAFAALTLAAVGAQFLLGLQRETFIVANFFSFFTIESNLIAAAMFLVTGVAALRGVSAERFALLRGAATLYMTLTGVIYVLLLRGLEASLQTPVPWVNAVLHYLMPLAVLADWLINPPHRIPLRRAFVWLLFPAAYVFYSLVRGRIVGWYPYPFLNVARNGYAEVALTSLVMLVGLTVMTLLLVARTWGEGRGASERPPS